IGLAGSVLSLLIDAHTLLLSYLATVVAFSSIAAGATAVLMLTYLVRGHWTEALHAPLTAAALSTPITGVLFLPVLLGMSWLYPWVQQPVSDPDSFKALWLTPWFFAARTVMYFTVWTALAFWVRRAWADRGRMVASASAGLIIYALTASLAGVDW